MIGVCLFRHTPHMFVFVLVPVINRILVRNAPILPRTFVRITFRSLTTTSLSFPAQSTAFRNTQCTPFFFACPDRPRVLDSPRSTPFFSWASETLSRRSVWCPTTHICSMCWQTIETDNNALFKSQQQTWTHFYLFALLVLFTRGKNGRHQLDCFLCHHVQRKVCVKQ